MPDSNEAEMPAASQQPFYWPTRTLVLMLSQLVVSLLATLPASGFTRTALFFVAVPLITTFLCTSRRIRSKYCVFIAALATTACVAVVHLLRANLDSNWFLGPFPNDLESMLYGVIVAAATLCAGAVGVVFSFSQTGLVFKSRWLVVGAIAALLVGSAVLARRMVWEPSPSDLLHLITQLQQEGGDSGARQQLSEALASCGREAEAEMVSRWMLPDSGDVAPIRRSAELNLSQLNPLPWRETFGEIADQHRLIVIMEAHNAPRHRQWIEQTLPILHKHGFRDYAAEGLGESGRSLKRRGYPVSSTGFYVMDPSFGNVLRSAIQLDFELHAYEAHRTDFAQREYQQAANIARLFAADPNLKLVVHAGYAHVYKRPRETGEKLMAAHLWEITGIEPYCIVQSWHGPDEGQARQLAELAELAGAAGEPVMLVPPPSDLSDPQFAYPPGAVDALVVHAPSVGGPQQRMHSFQQQRRRINAVWNGSQWPVLIGAFRLGESLDAIALDQVMLTEGQREFALWIQDQNYEIRVFGMQGRIDGGTQLVSIAAE